MTLTTGMSMLGSTSRRNRVRASPEKRTIASTLTRTVYGRRRARRTIHIHPVQPRVRLFPCLPDNRNDGPGRSKARARGQRRATGEPSSRISGLRRSRSAPRLAPLGGERPPAVRPRVRGTARQQQRGRGPLTLTPLPAARGEGTGRPSPAYASDHLITLARVFV